MKPSFFTTMIPETASHKRKQFSKMVHSPMQDATVGSNSGDNIEEAVGNTDLQHAIHNAATNIFLYTAANMLWRVADVFIVYIPYNVNVDTYR